MMEFTTPPSYGSTKVTVGGILKDGEIIYAGTDNKVTHSNTEQDPESEWPEPTSIKWEWSGKSADGQDVTAEVDGPLGKRLDRVDVMGEVPGFIKTIAGSVAGTRPYIFQVCFSFSALHDPLISTHANSHSQYSPKEKLSLKLNIGGVETVEEGFLFSESTFIS
jgi:hypothetical protein